MEKVKGTNIGILGGGQLGRMLVQAAMSYDVKMHILDSDTDAPCKNFTSHFIQNSFKDAESVLKFAEQCDVLSIEIEQVNAEALQILQDQGKMVIPYANVIKTIQDKGLQKEFLVENGLPTMPFQLINNPSEIKDYPHLLPGFLKLRKEGYDGKGVMSIQSASEITGAFQEPCLLEKKCDLLMELSVIVVADTLGNMNSYEPVESVFNPIYNLVDYLVCPARVSTLIAEQAKSLAEQCVEALSSPGVFAIEMFLDKNYRLYINEIAPRPHNSGHPSIEANACSQFDQLVRILSGLPIGSTKQTSPAIMLNIIGEDNYIGKPVYHGMKELLGMDGVYIHLYGKSETRPGRKMGHITMLGEDTDELMKKAITIKNTFKVIS